MMFYVNNRSFDSLDEAIEVAKSTTCDVTEHGLTVFSYSKWSNSVGEREAVVVRYPANDLRYHASEPNFIVHDPIEAYKAIEDADGAYLGKVFFNGQTLLYEADRLWEVAAIRGVVSFDDFAKFYRRLIPLLEELGISLDPDDERKARLEAEG